MLFELQLRLVVFHELLDLIGGAEQAVPLLIVESDGETAETIDADTAFFSDFKDQVSAAFLGFDFIFQLRKFRFQLLVGWFCHCNPSVLYECLWRLACRDPG